MAKDLEREKNENQPNLERTEENDEKVEETVKSVEPTVAALERLEKAVNKEPDPDLFNRPKPRNAYLDGYEKENISYNPLNSLIRRMTGAKDKVSHLEKAINPVETFKVRDDSRNEEGSLDSDISEDEDRQSEIPAFLRRQAN